ncbi:alpha/beta fold hydrolase [Pseudonocardia spinosispora]|uniref:alpha/beta fold hydrolase n=1 Tax=Pseudonocardia spinosispora TaxID=103441 RepID=UPI00048F7F2F|nr:alpha/beta hydrolase [Pseudonocardia spinosispora]
MSASRRRIAGSVIGGVLGAAATGAAVGAAARWSSLARERRKPHEEPAERGMLPAGVEWSVTADDDVRLSAEVIEPADGKRAALTVVLVHGFALDRRCWHFQRQALAEVTSPNVRLVLYDQRGHGRSERASRESCTIAQLGSDLQAVLRTLAPEGPVVLVGHSMGGMTIMALAESDPDLFVDRIVGVALLCTSAGEFAGQGLPGTFLSRRNPLTRTVGTLARLQPRFVERVRKMINDVVWGVTRAYAYGDRTVDHWLVDFVHEMISANGVDALINFVDTLNTHDRVAALPALSKCDTLVLAGGGDRLIPARHSEVIAAELPGATLIELPGVGHMAMLEQPEVVNEALVALVTRVGRPNGVVRRLRKRA